jgi:hypothetical protein
LINVATNDYEFKKVVVQDSVNVSEGEELYASPSNNWGNNSGWDFNTVYWQGDDVTNPTLWSVNENWTGGVKPSITDDVVFNLVAEQGTTTLVRSTKLPL